MEYQETPALWLGAISSPRRKISYIIYRSVYALSIINVTFIIYEILKSLFILISLYFSEMTAYLLTTQDETYRAH